MAEKVIQDPRPVVGVVAQDPAYTGLCGLVVRRFTTGTGVYDATLVHATSIHVRSPKLFRWLGDAVAACCRPGERLAFVAEGNAYGSLSVARQLGIAIGIVEGTVVDCNAVAAESRVDVDTRVWRTVFTAKALAAGRKAHPGNSKVNRRNALKAAAVWWAKQTFGLELGPDAAEALAISEWARLNLGAP